MVSALIERSGLAPAEWLRRYFEAYLVPLVHCLYAYELAFMPHGENVILVLEDGVPVSAVMKDIAEEIVVMGDRLELPDGGRADQGRDPRRGEGPGHLHRRLRLHLPVPRRAAGGRRHAQR